MSYMATRLCCRGAVYARFQVLSRAKSTVASYPPRGPVLGVMGTQRDPSFQRDLNVNQGNVSDPLLLSALIRSMDDNGLRD